LRWLIEKRGEDFHERLKKHLSGPFGSRDRRGVIPFFTPYISRNCGVSPICL
jgi:hypothetical protein